ncbi:hypothetical protein TNCV_3470011 [Trichonephila clavipes]|nr:hypothetical protein TNCV_3470011 [Trichonephila clavipes]
MTFDTVDGVRTVRSLQCSCAVFGNEINNRESGTPIDILSRRRYGLVCKMLDHSTEGDLSNNSKTEIFVVVTLQPPLGDNFPERSS